jgi:hypothetical protein
MTRTPESGFKFRYERRSNYPTSIFGNELFRPSPGKSQIPGLLHDIFGFRRDVSFHQIYSDIDLDTWNWAMSELNGIDL